MFWRVFWQFVKSFQQPFIICGCGYWVTGEINWAETLVLVSNNFFGVWIMMFFRSDLIRSESWYTITFFLIWSDLNHEVPVLSIWSDPIWIMMYEYFLSDLIRSESKLSQHLPSTVFLFQLTKNSFGKCSNYLFPMMAFWVGLRSG